MSHKDSDIHIRNAYNKMLQDEANRQYKHAIKTAKDETTKANEETAKAADLGIFGAPSFVAEDGEMFWGNDRLEDALDWAVRGTLRPNTQN